MVLPTDVEPFRQKFRAEVMNKSFGAFWKARPTVYSSDPIGITRLDMQLMLDKFHAVALDQEILNQMPNCKITHTTYMYDFAAWLELPPPSASPRVTTSPPSFKAANARSVL